MRVLVIEDNKVDFCLIERALGDAFTLIHATSLAAGVALAARDQFDLAILDLTLEDSNGYETFAKARAALARTPVLVLSGMADEELALRAVSNGAQDYIQKSRLLNYPLDRTARYAIERRRAEDAEFRRQQQAEAEIRESERFARSVVNALSAHIVILDETGKIIEVNTAWKRYLEKNGLQLRNYGIGENYLHVSDRVASHDDNFSAAVLKGIDSILNGKEQEFFLEYSAHSLVGEQQWFILRATRFEGEGPTRVVVFHQDITFRKVAERLTREQEALREATTAMEKVLGVVGHELRTPLAALRAISEYLITDGAKNTAEADKFLREITQEVDRMSDTVSNILEAARLNSGRARWNWSNIDLPAVIENAVATIRPLLDETRVRLEVCCTPSPFPIRGDSNAIQRLLINLLSNARKHTLQGRIEVHSRSYKDASGAWTELVVKDTGAGIPPELVARLGEAFSLNSGVVGHNHVSGTGLGLAICKGILLAHGGEIRIESVQQVGTTVTARVRADLEAAAQGDTIYVTTCQEIAA